MKDVMKKPSVLLLSVFTLLLIILAMFAFRFNVEKSLFAASCKTLDGVVDQQRLAFTAKLHEQQDVIKTYARFFQNSQLSEAEIVKELQAVAHNSTFNYMSYITSEGKGVRNTGERFEIAQRDYFKRAMSGETIITGPALSAVSQEPIIIFSTPIVFNSEVIGVLNGIYDTQSLSSLLLPAFDGTGHTYITTCTGEIVLITKNDNTHSKYKNLFDALSQVEYTRFDDYDHILDNISSRQAGHTQYSFEGENRFLHYAPLDINDWYIFTVAPESVIASQSLLIMRYTTVLMLGTCLLFLLILLYFYSEHHSHIKALKNIAYIDHLTKIYNKRKFGLVATKLLRTGRSYVMVTLDIDKFKVFNDTFGYECGDQLLISIANLLRENVRAAETFGRGDSDQFYILAEFDSNQTIGDRVETILSTITYDFQKTIATRNYRLVVYAGLYAIVDPDESISGICDKAKHALQLVKGSQNNHIAFYTEELRAQILKAKTIENRMHDALADEEFVLYLQPKYCLRTGEISGAEALARWFYQKDHLIYPGDFIPLFEKNGFITKLDLYMLEKSCIFIAKQIENGISPVPISINFSRLHLKNPNFVNEITQVVKKYEILPQLIEVELTESTMHENETALIEVLVELHSHGFTLSMDDFGSGYSSLGLLKNLPVDVVKLDRTFFTQYTCLKRAKTVISNIITLTRELDISTVAEGVETQESIDLLRELGCDIVQGYYFSKPMEAEEINKLLNHAGHALTVSRPTP